ncbi:MAG: serine hydrolase [Acidobacteriales bacterium]|nr:serine hydrolase [Terriglobales bacterium]
MTSLTYAQQRVPAPIRGLVAAHRGKVAVYARQLNTGKVIAVDEDIPVQTASVIKLTMLYEAMEQIREGKEKKKKKIVLKPGDAVSGSGVLTFMDPPKELTLKDVLTLMVILSDNTATNLAIDRFGVKAVNDRILALGLKDTHFYKKVMRPATEPMPEDQPKFGLGKTTAHEMAMVMEKIGRCDLGGPAQHQDEAICQTALNMLRNQFYRNTIPRYLETLDSSEAGSAIASKTGSLNAVRNDVAIVAAKSGPIVISIFTWQNKDTSWTTDNEGEGTIAKIAREIVQEWSPEGLDSRQMKPGLGLK